MDPGGVRLQKHIPRSPEAVTIRPACLPASQGAAAVAGRRPPPPRTSALERCDKHVAVAVMSLTCALKGFEDDAADASRDSGLCWEVPPSDDAFHPLISPPVAPFFPAAFELALLRRSAADL